MAQFSKKGRVNELCVKYVTDLLMVDSSDEDAEVDVMFEFNNKMLLLFENEDASRLPKSTKTLQNIPNNFHDNRNPIMKRNDSNNSNDKEISDNNFDDMLQVDPYEFAHLYDLIKDDEVFTNRYRVPQLPVEVQLKIVLFRLCSTSEDISIRKIASMFAVGDDGTIQLVTRRVFKAILNLKKRYLHWPSETERKEITARTIDELPSCIGYIDTMEIKLAEAPSESRALFFSQQNQYAIKMQAICDYKLRIRQATIGHPASVNDLKIFIQSPIAENVEKFLSDSQWIAGNSKYLYKQFLITPFDDDSKQLTKAARDGFNKYLLKYQSRIENCLHKLKEQFCSLKEMKFRMHTEKNRIECNEWIMVCCILHNIFIECNDTEVDDIRRGRDLKTESNMFSSGDLRLSLVSFINNKNI